jgi:arabinosyltransferase C
VWTAPNEIPAGADRVRVIAVDGSSDPDGWLALTGPRLRRVVPLTDYLRTAGPVLVNWPIAFVFPCIRDVVTVAHGIAAAPRAVLAPAARYDGLAGQSTDPGVAGVFAAVNLMGGLGEVPSRVAGHPDLDWGSLRLAGYQGAARDAFQVELSRVRLSGISGDDAQITTERSHSNAPDGQ